MAFYFTLWFEIDLHIYNPCVKKSFQMNSFIWVLEDFKQFNKYPTSHLIAYCTTQFYETGTEYYILGKNKMIYVDEQLWTIDIQLCSIGQLNIVKGEIEKNWKNHKIEK